MYDGIADVRQSGGKWPDMRTLFSQHTNRSTCRFALHTQSLDRVISFKRPPRSIMVCHVVFNASLTTLRCTPRGGNVQVEFDSAILARNHYNRQLALDVFPRLVCPSGYVMQYMRSAFISIMSILLIKAYFIIV